MMGDREVAQAESSLAGKHDGADTVHYTTLGLLGSIASAH
jgi:hypothetical protein